MNRLYYYLILCILIPLYSCSPKSSVSNSAPDKTASHVSAGPHNSNPPELDPSIIKKYNKFSYDFLADAVNRDSNSNILVSPISFEFLLSLMANGTETPASEEILRYLDIPTIEDLNNINRRWLWLAKDSDEYGKFELANSIWSSKKIKLKKEYKVKMESDYQASFHTLAEDPTTSQKDINIWAKEKTDGMIPEFLTHPLPPHTKLALYNATYFQGEWSDTFQKGNTTPDRFNTPIGEINVETMHNSYHGNYYSTEKYEAIDICYRRTFCMKIILPKREYSVEKVLPYIADSRAEECDIKVSLPKFSIRYRLENLKDYLAQKGVIQIFKDKKTFSPLSSSFLSFEDINIAQEAVINIDENGTRVAAVTGMMMAMESGLPRPKFKKIDFKVDRPFIFSIIERSSGAVIFTGVVNNPNDE